MAIYNAGYLSPIRKKLGNAVGRKWRTLDVLAVYQPFVSNPNTIAQRGVRARFSSIAKIAMSMDSILQFSFEPLCKGTKVPVRSMFIKKNWENVTLSDPTDPDGGCIADYQSFILSDGGVVPAACGSLSFATAQKVEVPLTDNTGGMALATDKVVLAAYSPEAGYGILGMSESSDRGDDDVALTFPPAWNGHRVHVWAITFGKEGTANEGKISESQYLGSGTVA